MNNLTVDELNRVRRLMGYSYELVAEESGVPLSTVQKVLGKQTRNPRPKTLEAIRNGISELIRKDEASGNVVHEKAQPYTAGCTVPPKSERRTEEKAVGGIKRSLIYNGRIYDAESAYMDIFRHASESIIVVDPAMNTGTLELIHAAKKDIPVIVYTDNEGREQRLTRQGMKEFFSANKSMRLLIGTVAGKYRNSYIVLDNGTPSEKVFLLSDSIAAPACSNGCIIQMKDTGFVSLMLKDLAKNSYLILK